MSKMWEIDPETRSKLLDISKTNENNRCVDCGAPSPQWASPKFGIFFCLACSGIHRSLGVHISFVRSITMDSFKTIEVERMRLGGNKPWREFFDAHKSNKSAGVTFDGSTIAERYDSEAGEEWKERLTCKVEGREFAGMPKKEARAVAPPRTGVTPQGSGRSTPVPTSTSSSNLTATRSPPPQQTITPQRSTSPSSKARNEAYFARMGASNASRPDNLPPSQGGKYGGFGSSAPPLAASGADATGVPTADEFQRDPMAALTKGFGWLSSTVSKQAIAVNQSYIQPGLKSVQDGEFAAQARGAAMTAGTYVQQGARGVGDQFNKFVDPEYHPDGNTPATAPGGLARGRAEPEKKDFWDSFGQAPSGPPKEKKGFWDDFAAAGSQAGLERNNSKGSSGSTKSGAIGTSAMKSTKKEEEGGWGDW